MGDIVTMTDLACIKESSRSINKELTEIKYIMRQILLTLEVIEAKLK